MTARTIAGAEDYWEQYYADEFIPGLGTEQILAALARIPAAGTWLDLGSGSESLLWSIALHAGLLIAADRDPQRLRLLRDYAASGKPRGAYRTVLTLCGQDEHDFAERCRRLRAAVAADCLSGTRLPISAGCANLVTQFGLLGLAAGHGQFLRAWDACHEPLAARGWIAGANWNAPAQPGRVTLTEHLYRAACARSGVTLLHIERVPITADPDFDSVWIYLGRTK
jgi:hypothetical protein